MEVSNDSKIHVEYGARITWPDGHTEDWWGTKTDVTRWLFYHDGVYSVCTSQLISRSIITTPAQVVRNPPSNWDVP